MLITIISLATSVGTLSVMYLLSSKRRAAWLVSLANQSLWFWLIYLTEAWGLLPLSICMTVIAVRGWIKWKS